jgi:hypothetical protein
LTEEVVYLGREEVMLQAVYGLKNLPEMLGVSLSRIKRLREELIDASAIFCTHREGHPD